MMDQMSSLLKSAIFYTFIIFAYADKSLVNNSSPNSPKVNVTNLSHQNDLDETESNITLTIVLANNSTESELLPGAEALVGTYPHDFSMTVLPSISRRSSYDQGGGQGSRSHNFEEQGLMKISFKT